MELLKRTLTGIILVVLMTGAILGGPATFIPFYSLVAFFTSAELIGLVNEWKGAHASPAWSGIAIVCMSVCTSAFCAGNSTEGWIFLGLCLLTFMIIMIRELYIQKESPILDWAVSLMAIVYTGVPFCLLEVLGLLPGLSGTEGYSPVLPLALFIFIWCNDVGAYCIGCTFGKHRLFERVSPKKSWEGFFGGCLFSVLAGLAVSHFSAADNMSALAWAGLALTISVTGTFGDLVESLLKREIGVKDSGKTLPGHGGLLDRFDSTLIAVPATIVYMLAIRLLS